MEHLRQPACWSERHKQALQDIAREAGACILAHRAASTLDTQRKPDGSHVTAADREAERIILAGLNALTPDIPVVAEEKDNPAHLADGGTYWLVDPLDGTRDYVEGGDEFSVNIGLVVAHEPCLGVLYAPQTDDLFYGDPNGALRVNAQGAHALVPTPPPSAKAAPRLLTSRREARHVPVTEWLLSGEVGLWRACSSAYKFGLLAAGEFDVFLRTGTTYEWDTAAGDAILRAVGGRIITPDNRPLVYGKPDFRNGTFIASTGGFGEQRTTDFLALLSRD